MKKQFLLIVAVASLTLVAFAVSWIQFIRAGQKIDKTHLKIRPLRVLSYATFVSQDGPGPALGQLFFARTGRRIEWLNVGDSHLLKLKLQQRTDHFMADMIIGLDAFSAAALESTVRFKPLPFPLPEMHEAISAVAGGDLDKGQSKGLIPYDWSPLTFIYNSSLVKEPPSSLAQLLDSQWQSKVSLPDPRLASLGAFFFFFFQNGPSAGDQPGNGISFPATLAKLKAANWLWTDSWSQSYGLFQRKQVLFTFSFLTSLIFHWRDDTQSIPDQLPASTTPPSHGREFQALNWASGHPFLIESAGVLESCRSCEDAFVLLQILLEPEVQTLIATKNYMLPVIKKASLPSVFSELPTLKLQKNQPELATLNQWIDSLFRGAEH